MLLGLDVRFGHHVQGPAGKLAGQAHVLAATTNGLGQVVFGNGDVHCMGIFVDDDRHHFGRSHGVDHELRRVVVPQDDIDALAAQFAGYGLDAGTAHADAGALRVDALVLGANGDLGAGTRVTGGGHHFDQLFGDFRHFDAEQFDQHLRRGARQDQLRATVLGADFLQQGTHAGADAESLARNDVLAGQQCFGIVAEVDDHVIAGDLLHSAGDDVAQLLAVGLDNLRTLGFAHFLHDDLLGGLGCDAAELDGLDLLFDDVADLGFLITFLGLIQGQLDSRILEISFLDNSPATEGVVITALTIDRHTQVDLVLVTLLGSSGQRQLQRLENHAGRYTFFVGYRLNNQQYFFAHRTPRLSQSIGSAGSASQSKRGMMLALSISSIGRRNSRSSMRTTTSCSSTPRRSPWKLRRPSKGERSLILTSSPAWAANCSRVNSGRSMPGDDTSRVYSLLIGSSTSSTPLI
ncbi:hypothetical protein D9M71_310680 [compost metagenome]